MPLSLKTPFINIGSSMSSSSENEEGTKCDSDESDEIVTAKVTTEDPAPTCPLTTANKIVDYNDSSSDQELLENPKIILSDGIENAPEITVESDDQILIETFMENVNSKENEILGSEKMFVQLEENPYNEKIEIVEEKSILKPTFPVPSTDVVTGGILSKLSKIFSFVKTI